MKSIQELKQIFEDHGFNFYHASDTKTALALIKTLIPLNTTVSVGGSQTLQQVGILDYLEKEYIGTYLDRHHCDDINTVFFQAQHAHYYLSSVNALISDGSFYCVDGFGNRVASILFGTDNVILVVGKNKLVETFEQAQKRVETIAAPKNALRLNKDTPCLHQKCCYNDKVCMCKKKILVTSGDQKRITILLVDEELGY